MSSFVVFRVPDGLVDRIVPAVQVGAELVGVDCCKVGEGTALMAIIAPGGLLDSCDSVDVYELAVHYVPRARQQAVASEARTRPVRLPQKDTQVIPAGVIRREFAKAHAEHNDLGGEG